MAYLWSNSMSDHWRKSYADEFDKMYKYPDVKLLDANDQEVPGLNNVDNPNLVDKVFLTKQLRKVDKIAVYLTASEMNAKHNPLFQIIRSPHDRIEQIIENLGTQAYKDSVRNNNQASLTRYKEFYKNKEEIQPAPTVNAPTDVTDLLDDSEGICIGESHNDTDSNLFMLAELQAGNFATKGVGVLFIEEIYSSRQGELDAYFDDATGTIDDPAHASLKAYLQAISAVNTSTGKKDMKFLEIVTEAKAQGIRVYGINSYDIETGYYGKSGAHQYYRDANMNVLAQNVMENALTDLKKRAKNDPSIKTKFVAHVGAVHARTHPGGIPGIAEMFGVPAVKMSGGVLEGMEEDLSYRMTPSPTELTQYLAEFNTNGISGPDMQVYFEKKRNKTIIDLVKTKPAVHTTLGDTLILAVETAGYTTASMKNLIKGLYDEVRAKMQAISDWDANPTTVPQERVDLVNEMTAERAALETILLEVAKQAPELYVRAKFAPNDQTLMHIAAGANLGTVGEKLAEHPLCDVDARDSNNVTPIQVSIQNNPSTDPTAKDFIKKVISQAYTNLNDARTQISEWEKANSKSPNNTSLKQWVDKFNRKYEDFGETVRDLMNGSPDLLINDTLTSKNISLAQMAASSENPLALRKVLSNPNVDVNAPLPNGMTLAHQILSRRTFLNEELRAEQLRIQNESLVELLKRDDVDLDKQDNNGFTPLHHAALTGNAFSTENLIVKGANHTITDNRGWTPFDVAQASTKNAVEKYYLDEDLAVGTTPRKGTDKSVVDILMSVTKCVKPSDVAKMKAHYEYLYANKSLRPLLKMAAIDALQDREYNDDGTVKSGGVRIFVSDTDATGTLYAAPIWYAGGHGAFDNNANTFLLGANRTDAQVEGTLIHEMTHMLVKKLYGKDTVPFKKDDEDGYKKYRKAIKLDMAHINRTIPVNKDEEAVVETMSKRMETYAGRGADEQLLQEFIVGIPQLIVELGEEMVQKFCPNLYAFFGDFTEELIEKMDDEFDDLADTIDNTDLDLQLQQHPIALRKAKSSWAPSAFLTPEELVERLRRQQAILNGNVKAPNGGKIPYLPSHFETKPGDANEINRILGDLLNSMKKEGFEGMLPKKVSGDGFRKLLDGLAEYLDEGMDLNKADAFFINWARNEKVSYVNNALSEGLQGEVDYADIAEAIIILAEDKAFANLPVDHSLTDIIEVDPTKHQALINKLKEDLETRFPTLDLPTLKKIGGNTVSVANGLLSNASLYVKRKNRQAHPNHVSIDKKKARNAWLNKLRQIN